MIHQFNCLSAFARVTTRHKGHNEEIKDFEKEFHEYFNGEGEEKAEKQLEETEASIEKENEAYEKGEANFKEKLNEFSYMSKEQFEKEKEGAVMPTKFTVHQPIHLARAMGLIMPDPETVKLTPEEQAYLDEIYSRADPPPSYDARKLGIVQILRGHSWVRVHTIIL